MFDSNWGNVLDSYRDAGALKFTKKVETTHNSVVEWREVHFDTLKFILQVRYEKSSSGILSSLVNFRLVQYRPEYYAWGCDNRKYASDNVIFASVLSIF